MTNGHDHATCGIGQDPKETRKDPGQKTTPVANKVEHTARAEALPVREREPRGS